MRAGAGSARGHVTAAIRAPGADAPLPPRLLSGCAPSRRPASPSHQPAAAAAARAPAAPWQVCAAPPAAPGPPAPRPARPRRLPPAPRPSAPGEFPAGRAPPQSCGLVAAGRGASCVSGGPAARRPGRPLEAGAQQWAPPGGAGPPPTPPRLLPSPRPSSLPLAPRRAGGAAAWGCVGVGSRLPGRWSRARGRSGIEEPPPTPGSCGGAAARQGRRRPRPSSSAARPGAGRHAEPIFRPLGPGFGKPEPGERLLGAGPARREGAGPLVARCRGCKANLPQDRPKVPGPSRVVGAESRGYYNK